MRTRRLLDRFFQPHFLNFKVNVGSFLVWLKRLAFNFTCLFLSSSECTCRELQPYFKWECCAPRFRSRNCARADVTLHCWVSQNLPLPRRLIRMAAPSGNDGTEENSIRCREKLVASIKFMHGCVTSCPQDTWHGIRMPHLLCYPSSHFFSTRVISVFTNHTFSSTLSVVLCSHFFGPKCLFSASFSQAGQSHLSREPSLNSPPGQLGSCSSVFP